MVSRYHPRINKKIEVFLTKYSSFRPVFNELMWLKSTDSQVKRGMSHVPCWVQQGEYTLSVVLNEEILLKPEYTRFVPFFICHEILHIMKSHFIRFAELPAAIAVQEKLDQAIKDKLRPECDKFHSELEKLSHIWNIATDAAINAMFEASDKPPNVVSASHFGLPQDLSAEDYFQHLYSQFKEKEAQQDEEADSGEALGVNIVKENPLEGDPCPEPDSNSEDKSPENPGGKSKEEENSKTGPDGNDTNSDEADDPSEADEADDPSEANKCTCGDTSGNAKPCVHVLPQKEAEDDPVEEPSDDPDPQFDPAEILNRAMEEGLKDLAATPGVCGIGESDLGSTPKGNFKEVLMGAENLDNFQHKIVSDFKECESFKWERLLSGFMKSGSKVDLKFSRKRRNRRYGTRPGVQIVQKKRVAFIIDTSYSMNTQKIKTLKPIIDSLASIMDVIVIHCDQEVRHCEKWATKDFIELKGGGGTLGEPAIKKACQIKVDGAIYYTDGGFYDRQELKNLKKPPFDFIWLLVGVTEGSLSSSVVALPSWGQRVIVD